MIKNYLKKHGFYYGIVLVTQVLGLIAIAANNGQRTVQIIFVILMASFYIMWGVIHHSIHHTLHAKIVMEYVLMAILAISVVYFLL